MGKLQRLWQVAFGKEEIQYEDESSANNSVSVKDILRFMEKQQESNGQLMGAIASASLAQAETMKTYIDLFKPRDVKSTTLDERDSKREHAAKVRESEWEGIADPQTFNRLMTGSADGIPPDFDSF